MQKVNKTLSEVLQGISTSKQGITFISRNQENRITYSELHNKAQGVLYSLQNRGMRYKDELVFQVEDNYSFILVFWACILGGIIPVPITSGNNEEHKLKLARIWSILHKPYLVTTQEVFQQLEKYADNHEGFSCMETMQRNLILMDDLEQEAGIGSIQPIETSDIALIQFSSGSTGDPKGVVLTHENILCNINAIINGAVISPMDSALSWMPLTHDMGLIGFHIASLTANINQYLMPPTLFILDPELWLQKAHEHRVTVLSSPNFGYRHFLNHHKAEHIGNWELSQLRLLFNGAEPISAELCQRFLNAIAPSGARESIMFPVYGMAEASLAVTFPPADEAVVPIHLDRGHVTVGEQIQEIDPHEDTCVTYVDVGYPVQDCEVRICDHNNRVMEEKCIGNIHIKGKNVTQGYYNNPIETNKLITADGWLNTGDLGFLRNGRLIVTGRMKDIIFVRGQNYYPHDLESIAQTELGIELGKMAICGISSGEAGMGVIAAFVVHRGKLEGFINKVIEVKRILNKAAGLEIRYVIPVKNIPKTTSGKLQRYKLVESYDRGELTEVIEQLDRLLDEKMSSETIELPSNELEKQLIQIWADVLGLRTVGIQADFFELGGDSLKAALLLNQIHKAFHVEIPTMDLYELSTVRKLALYLQNAKISNYYPIPHAEQQDYYPVSSSQYRVYVQEQFAGIGTSYNMPVVIHIEGKLDLAKAEAAFQELINRHETLRTSFVEVEGNIMQVIHPKEQVKFALQECHNKSNLQETVDAFIQPFPMNEAPLFRVGVISSKDEQISMMKSQLVVDSHHTITDGISINHFIEQFVKLYSGEDLARPALQYKDYVLWQQEKKYTENRLEHQLYWQEQLKGEIPLLEMPTDHKRSELRSFQGESIQFPISPIAVGKLNELALTSRVSVNTILLSIYGVLLSKYTRQQDLIVGSLVSGRNHTDLTSVLGMFINYIPLRLNIDSEMTFKDTLHNCGTVIAEAYSHQDFPYEDMISYLEMRTPQGRNPLFDTMLIMHNQMDIGREIQAGDLKLRFEEWRTNTSKLDFKLDVYVEGSGLSCSLEYNCSLFKRETMERLCEHYLAIIQAIIHNPNIHLGEIDIVTGAEREQILHVFNQEEVYDSSNDIALHEWFEKSANRQPDATALILGDQRMTYRELNDKANRLAHVLRSKGLGSNSIAAIAVERSFEMMIGIMAILKAGGAYLPISPDAPPERIRFMLEDSEAVLLLTQSRYVQLLTRIKEDESFVSVPYAGVILNLEDEDLYPIVDSEWANLELPAVDSGDLAYVIYTSGSTGNPKGVMIEHRAVVNRIRWMQKQYPIAQADVIIQKTAFTFDVSVWELFWWSFTGASLSLLEPGGEKDPAVIVRTIEEHQVTTVHFVPSMLHLFLDHLERQQGAQYDESLKSLKYVFASGEALPPQQVNRFYRWFKPSVRTAKIINLYGPTEAAIDVSYYDCRAEEQLDSVPIGKPIDNIQLYILNESGQLLPVGVPGELYIAGIGLARGYIRLSELTAEKFIDNPFVPGTRMYRTGDLARWQPDGTIVYMGRLDHQVKLRGYRIELGEIESGLLRHSEVLEAVVIVNQAPDGDKHLSAYLVCSRELTIAELRSHLVASLPDYMIPTHFSLLEKMPLTSNGKVDRKSLEGQVSKILSASSEYIAPSDEYEEKLAVIWKSVLQLERVGGTDHFFEIGGHSLKATELLHQVHKELQVNLTLKDIFNYPTIRQIASIVRKRDKSAYAPIPAIVESEFYPLSPAQSRLFILQQFEEIGTSYHLPVVFTYEGAIDPVRFELTLKQLIIRHESLRTSFRMKEGQPVQSIHSEFSIVVEHRVGTEASIPDIVRNFIQPFDLSQAPLIQAGIIQLPHGKQLILFDMHHLVSDGVSMGILVHDFVEIYEGRELFQPIVQYKDFAGWQQQMMDSGVLKEQEQYWLEQFADEVPTLQLLTDYNRPSFRSFEGDKQSFHLSKEEMQVLHQFARDKQITLYMALLAVFNIFLARYSGQEDIVVGTPVSGRSHADLQQTVGMFVNTLPLRNYPQAVKTFNTFVQELKESTLTAFGYQDYPFEELVGKLKLTRSLSRNPLFDVVFVMQNMTIPELTLDHRSLKPYEFQHTTAKFDLTVEAIETEQGLTCHFEYCTKLFRKETVGQWMRHYRQILKEVIANPDITIGEIDMLAPEETSKLISPQQSWAVDYPREKTIHQLFEEQAERTPQHIAVICGKERVTYRDLNERTNRLAGLLRSQGVVPDQRVALMLDRSVEMIVGMLAILKAGGAYVPIDPAYPADRIAFMVTDSGAIVVLTETKYMSELEQVASTLIDVTKLPALPSHNLQAVNTANDMAYIIYTSGTTGKPKGVMIEHRNVVRLMINDKPLFDFNDHDVWTMFHSYCFDFSVWEMYGALLFGGSLVVLEKDVVKDPERLLDVLVKEKVSVFNQTPSSFYPLIRYELERKQPKLQFRYVIFGGEALKPAMLKPWKERYPDTKLVNMYGITETTVHVTYKEITDQEIQANLSPIGEPIPTLSSYILDRNLKLVPPGVAGELFVGGEGVARGYMNRPELTAEKFIPNPYRAGETLYRSGDLACWSIDYEMEYLGRIDHQVKIRGFRIELGEIENRLQQHPDIFEAVVLVKDSAIGDKELWAYIATKLALTNADLRKHLAATLPEYMIPAFYVQLDNLPLTVNGKIDRNALLQLEADRQTSTSYTAPQNEREEKLSEIWQEVLVLDRVGAHDNFFDIGGHSLLLLRMHALVEKQYPGIVKVTDLFAYPTIHTLAAFMEAEAATAPSKEALRHIELPASYFTNRLGQTKRTSFKYQLDSGLSAVLMQMAKELQGELEPLLTAIYLHLFAQITKRAEQTVFILSPDQNVYSLGMDLSAYGDALSLAKAVQQAADQAQAERIGHSIKKLNQSKLLSTTNGIYPLFYKYNRSGANSQLENGFDLTFAYHQENDQITFYCSYDESKLLKDKMKELFQGYVKLLGYFAKQYSSRQPVAAVREGAVHE